MCHGALARIPKVLVRGQRGAGGGERPLLPCPSGHRRRDQRVLSDEAKREDGRMGGGGCGNLTSFTSIPLLSNLSASPGRWGYECRWQEGGLMKKVRSPQPLPFLIYLLSLARGWWSLRHYVTGVLSVTERRHQPYHLSVDDFGDL